MIDQYRQEEQAMKQATHDSKHFIRANMHKVSEINKEVQTKKLRDSQEAS